MPGDGLFLAWGQAAGWSDLTKYLGPVMPETACSLHGARRPAAAT